MKEINVTVIGSGSTYCPELVDGFLKAADHLKVKRLVLMDIDERKRVIVGGLCERMLKAAGSDCEVVLTDDLDESLKGADFVVTQIRVGKLWARFHDETIPLKYDLIGQETTGIGGFFKALRTIPVIGHIAERMEVICPGAVMINFTNPSGIVSEFLQNHTNIRSVGLCNVPIDMYDDIKENLGEDVKITYVGLNHLSWVISVIKDGEECIDRMFDEGFAPKTMANIHDDGFDLECLRSVRGIPSSYLQYFYSRDAKLEYLKREPRSRAENCMEIEEKLLKIYADPAVTKTPELLGKRGGHKYSLVAVNLIDAIANDLRTEQVIDIRNNGTLDFMADDDVVEIAAYVGSEKITPVAVPHFENEHIKGLMRIVKAYEKLTVKAAMDGDDEAALNALMLHPLVGDYKKAKACYDEMKIVNAEFLPQFFGF